MGKGVAEAVASRGRSRVKGVWGEGEGRRWGIDERDGRVDLVVGQNGGGGAAVPEPWREGRVAGEAGGDGSNGNGIGWR